MPCRNSERFVTVNWSPKLMYLPYYIYNNAKSENYVYRNNFLWCDVNQFTYLISFRTIPYIWKIFVIISIIKPLINLFLDVINHGIFLGNSLMCDKRFYNTKDNKLCSIVARQYHWLIKKIYAVMILGILKWPCVSQHTIIRISVASFCVDRIFSTCIIYEYYDKCACKCQPKY